MADLQTVSVAGHGDTECLSAPGKAETLRAVGASMIWKRQRLPAQAATGYFSTSS